VDHIFFFPAKRLLSFEAHVVDNDLTHSISDHLPVVADLVIE
jgi:endonuclease/exonuclease/phosphatase family metal-dependent hydrolase